MLYDTSIIPGGKMNTLTWKKIFLAAKCTLITEFMKSDLDDMGVNAENFFSDLQDNQKALMFASFGLVKKDESSESIGYMMGDKFIETENISEYFASLLEEKKIGSDWLDLDDLAYELAVDLYFSRYKGDKKEFFEKFQNVKDYE